MLLEESTLDDLLTRLFNALHSNGRAERATRGNFIELTGVLIKLRNPRARLSRSESKGKPFSCIGELFWYLSGRNDLNFIEYFIPDYHKDAEDDKTLHGAYGPRIFPADSPSQVAQIIELLRTKPTSRRAVIQLFSSDDISYGSNYKDIPCTTTIQFLIRNERLECFASMRSNDAFKGLPHDIFCFTMIQEMIARSLDIDCGTYNHFASSLHLYEDDISKSHQYLDEGLYAESPMPPMPNGDQFWIVPSFLDQMEVIRQGAGLAGIDDSLPDYWTDLLRLLVAYRHSGDIEIIDRVQDSLIEKNYFPYVERRKIATRPKANS